MKPLSLISRILPWVIAITLGVWVYWSYTAVKKAEVVVDRSAVLQKIESMGKIELVRYNFKEITEVKEISKEYFRLFKLGPDSKIALISEGHAVGCLDLTKITKDDVLVKKDTIYIKLPAPEICYYKLDMENTRIYYLQTNPLKDEKAFIQKAYKHAEREIRDAALNSGILEQTQLNAQHIMRPMLEAFSGSNVVLLEHMKGTKVEQH